MTKALTEAQIRRAVKGAIDAGFAVGSVEITSDGTIRLLPAAARDATVSAGTVDARKPKSW